MRTEALQPLESPVASRAHISDSRAEVGPLQALGVGKSPSSNSVQEELTSRAAPSRDHVLRPVECGRIAAHRCAPRDDGDRLSESKPDRLLHIRHAVLGAEVADEWRRLTARCQGSVSLSSVSAGCGEGVRLRLLVRTMEGFASVVAGVSVAAGNQGNVTLVVGGGGGGRSIDRSGQRWCSIW